MVLTNNLKDGIDVFICSASLEERCFSIPKVINDLEIQNKIVFYFDDLYESIKQNEKKIQELLGSTSETVNIQIGNPGQMLKTMGHTIDSLIQKEKKQKILVDITTFTHEGVLILLKLLQYKLKADDQLFVCYTGAKEYSYNETNPEKKWLSKGVKSVRSIVGYPGNFDPSKSNHLVILFGFERERTKTLIDIFEYDVVSIAFGSKHSSITPEHQLINEKRHEELFDFYPNTKKFEISLINPYETKKQILDHLIHFKECNTVIAPMNNKISTIGAGLAVFERPSIQLCYLTANSYNYDYYSIPDDHCHFFKIESESLSSNSCRIPGD